MLRRLKQTIFRNFFGVELFCLDAKFRFGQQAVHEDREEGLLILGEERVGVAMVDFEEICLDCTVS